MPDVWTSGDAYEPYIGRWSRIVAVHFLEWLDEPPGRRWLDVGCGTGALTSTILAEHAPTQVVGVDPSEGFIHWVTAHVDDPRATFQVTDASHLPEVEVDVVVSGLVMNFVPDLGAALSAMRAAAPSGIVAAYVWDYADRMDLLRYFWDAARALDPGMTHLDEAVRFPICNPDQLAIAWRDARFGDVEVRAIDVPTIFRDFDDYWSPFLSGHAPAPSYAMSLDEQHRARLRDHIRAALPTQPDGSIDLIARAWAVRGRSSV